MIRLKFKLIAYIRRLYLVKKLAMWGWLPWTGLVNWMSSLLEWYYPFLLVIICRTEKHFVLSKSSKWIFFFPFSYFDRLLFWLNIWRNGRKMMMQSWSSSRYRLICSCLSLCNLMFCKYHRVINLCYYTGKWPRFFCWRRSENVLWAQIR